MEPANVLFVIAFIGLPIAFGVWALASRRELRRSAPPPDTSEPTREPGPHRPVRRRRSPEQQAEQTVQAPPVREETQTQTDERTVQVPAAQPDPAPQPDPEPEPSSEHGWSGSSGTTEEFPIVGIPEPPSPESEQPVRVVSNLGRAGQTQPLPSAPVTPAPALPARRPFYPPRYAGKSAGVVKRLAPLETQRFLALRSRARRR